ncbi:MAG: 50S ribosomal protein L29 [Candidatus Omnitrophica bacterium CG11_big_fil_rev_8_21_14_0_20_41_12]|nr:MAG: 50S ribosomal protein L29 [Candidatus Omnitrophica bacterium CG11_big_fil_rev_8_21_14_0_20_41_12]
MKTKELIDLAVGELLEKEKTLYAELSKLNLQRYTGRVEKPHKFALIKKDIARIRTILNQKKDK